jgi:hypothetical protein
VFSQDKTQDHCGLCEMIPIIIGDCIHFIHSGFHSKNLIEALSFSPFKEELSIGQGGLWFRVSSYEISIFL